jgi:NADH-quinone oxidoreductase subunit G
VPRSGPGDDILLSEDRNPNTKGARLILGLTSDPGKKLPLIAQEISSGNLRALIALGEDPTKLGITTAQLAALPTFIIMDILANAATPFATSVFPSFGFAEKRGSMINGKGRLQRLNRAVTAPGETRDDWEILRDLIQACAAQNGIYSIEDVFREMSAAIPNFAGLNLGRIGDLGVQVLEEKKTPPPGEPAKETPPPGEPAKETLPPGEQAKESLPLGEQAKEALPPEEPAKESLPPEEQAKEKVKKRKRAKAAK